MKKLLLAGVAVLLLTTGAAHADTVYGDGDGDENWSGCKNEELSSKNDDLYYWCENGHGFEFLKDGYRRGERICKVSKSEKLPGPESPRLVQATCKENDIEQFEVSMFFSCCGNVMVKRVYVYPELTQ